MAKVITKAELVDTTPQLTSSNTLPVGSAGAVLLDIECYSSNISELARDLRVKLTDPVTGQFKEVSFEFVRDTINEVVQQFKETALECEGKDINIRAELNKLGLAGSLIVTVLTAAGIEL